MNSTRLDFESVASRVDLPKLIESEGLEIRRGMLLCPFHLNENSPAMSVFTKGGRWRYRCHSCGAAGDAIAWVAARRGVTPLEAARQLSGIEGRPSGRKAGQGRRARKAAGPDATAKVKPPRPPSPIDDPAWQAAVDSVVRRAEQTLWGRRGSAARAYLRARGLDDHTIKRFRLGYVPEGYQTDPLEVLPGEDGRPRPIYAARGIVLPWIRPGTWFSAGEDPAVPRWLGGNVRCLQPDVFAPMPHRRKCHALLGSVRGHAYPHPDLYPSQAGPPALIGEGEFDAMLADQEAGDIVHALTVGGSSQNPHPTALDALAWCPFWMLAHDHDAAGARAALRWQEMAPHKSYRTLLPTGKDITEYHLSGGNVREWIRREIDLIGAS